ncbi:MAG: ABC transporter ATP-binding protein [Actinobacteria bacterium]|nr:ABC transporter ATP-binding protein [Actinomycetota bacterium]
MALVLIQAVANLYLPTLNADIIDDGIVKGDIRYIIVTGSVMLGITLVLALVAIVSVYWGSRTSMSLGRDLRHDLFRTVQGFSLAEVNRFGAPSLITRTTNDVQQIQMVVLMMLNVVLLAPLLCVGGIIMALRLNLSLSWLILVVIPVMSAFIGIVGWRAIPLFRAMQKRIDRVNQVTREVLGGIRVIRAFDREDYEQRRYDEANVDLTGVTLRVNRLFALMLPVLMAIMNLSTVAVMWFGGRLVADGRLPIGDLTAFLTYIVVILMGVLMATIMFVMVPRAAASAERIAEVLDVEPTVTDPQTPTLKTSGRGCVELRDVEFRYPGAEEPVLTGISFAAGPGEVTAIVGSTGSGKSTLVNLIPRFYDVTAGSITVDGVDVRELDRQDLWRRIGFVPQKSFLFSGTVADNLRHGAPDAGEEELWRLLEIAQGADFVRAMPEKLEAPITQGGANVSGGQRQRLAIARALARRAEIYVFDDSFSALDFATESRLRAALRRETTAATVLIVAQRVGSIMTADRIVVLEDGAVAGIGTHDELLRTSETYREIVVSQLGEEEVA